MLRVVDYSRVSTEEEKQVNALKTQIEENERYIQSNPDWTLVDRYIDEGKSATTTEGRHDFLRLLDDMQNNKFDIILIKTIDRGWRNTLDWKLFERELINNNIRLFIRMKNNFYNFEDASDYMATNFEAMFSEWFSRNQSMKINNANKTRMGKGNVLTNGKIWGYKQENAKLEIIEEEATVVRQVFEMYASGLGFRAIAKKLDEMGIKNQNGNPFALTTLKRMIRQEKYKGTLICGKRHKNFFTKKIEKIPEEEWVIHEDAVPAIVSKEIWEAANEVLAGKRKHYNLEETSRIAGYFQGNYAYSGKIKCATCGNPYYHNNYFTRKGTKISQWQCKSYREKGIKGCVNIKIPCEELDEIVKTVIYDFWKNKDTNIKHIIKILENTAQENDDIDKINKLEKGLDKLKNKKDKLIELYTDDLISKEDYLLKSKDYDSQLSKISLELEELKEKNSELLNRKEQLKLFENFFSLDIENKDMISDEMIKLFLKEITVDGSVLTIVLNIGLTYKHTYEKKKKSHNVTVDVKDWTHKEINISRGKQYIKFFINVQVYI